MKARRGTARLLALVLTAALCMGMLGTAALAAEEPWVSAWSAVVMDYDTGEILYAKDADTPRVPASMTKVMTAS